MSRTKDIVLGVAMGVCLAETFAGVTAPMGIGSVNWQIKMAGQALNEPVMIPANVVMNPVGTLLPAAGAAVAGALLLRREKKAKAPGAVEGTA